MQQKEQIMFLMDLMKRQLLVFDDYINETEQQLERYKKLPDRTLVVRKRSGRLTDYYEQEYIDGKKVLLPLGKGDSEIVSAYKRRRFLLEQLRIFRNNIKAIKLFLSRFSDWTNEAVQELLPETYRSTPSEMQERTDGYAIHIPDHLPDEIRNDEKFRDLVEWADQKYKRNPYPLPEEPNIARDGTPMRSKGECMWYDNILFEGLPVRVEPELIVQGISKQWHKLYPDFQFKCFNGRTILVEHFGEWDEEEYAERNKRKIQAFLDCGFVLGDNLIVTSDNAYHHTNELAILEALEIVKRQIFR